MAEKKTDEKHTSSIDVHALLRITSIALAIVIAFGAGHMVAASQADQTVERIISASKQGIEQVQSRNQAAMGWLETRFIDQKENYDNSLERTALISSNIISYLSGQLQSTQENCRITSPTPHPLDSDDMTVQARFDNKSKATAI